MKVTKRWKDNWCILAIKGDFDLNNVETVKSILTREIDGQGGNMRLVADLGGLEYIDSSGLGVLINTAVRIKGLSATFILMNIPESIGRILELTKLKGFFRIVRDEDELRLISPAKQGQHRIIDMKTEISVERTAVKTQG